MINKKLRGVDWGDFFGIKGFVRGKLGVVFLRRLFV